MTLDLYMGPVEAPHIEVNPLDETVDLVWERPSFRKVVSLLGMEELRLLVARAMSVVNGETVA